MHKNKQGIDMAEEQGHGVLPSGRAGTLLSGAVHWLTDNSVVLYLALVASQRIWVVLNSDVGELLRRHTH
jgi:hypothetical protein